jgi:hypothetical protein
MDPTRFERARERFEFQIAPSHETPAWLLLRLVNFLRDMLQVTVGLAGLDMDLMVLFSLFFFCDIF